jgi:hypothetical protein
MQSIFGIAQRVNPDDVRVSNTKTIARRLGKMTSRARTARPNLLVTLAAHESVN